jgi:hypothetical protein
VLQCFPVFNLSVCLNEKLDLVGCGRSDMAANIVNKKISKSKYFSSSMIMLWTFTNGVITSERDFLSH